ncbi:MAG: relaxase/mobilization nuclease domain-containing protein [Lachnospiraceae bacterium]|nr:relaxase/mobilization nuclease domain-containing protein [Lachnospiraceae bacterium]
MAITKIINIGGNSPTDGARHLKAALKYIMNPKKTSDGIFVGGNCGNTVEECYSSMMQTKADWDKTDGRQAYHIVLSFPPGEGDEETIFAVAKEFCEEYLGNGYEYAFSVHNDQPHLHAHIIFNSVNRLTGVKYHYNNGDWERYMQPVTDRICEKYGLSKLHYEKEGPRVGRSYAEHLANEEGRLTWEKIIKRDIDFAVSQVKDIPSFKAFMTSLGYELRQGHSEKHGDYITYIAPGEGDPRHRSKRDYRMGSGYLLRDLMRRMGEPEIGPRDVPRKASISDILISRPGRPLSRFQVMAVYRLQRLDDFHFLDLDQKEQERVREDLLKIDKLREEVDMILARDLRSKSDCEKEFDRIKAEIRDLDKDDPALKELRKDKNILRRVINGYKVYEEVKEAKVREDIAVPTEPEDKPEKDTTLTEDTPLTEPEDTPLTEAENKAPVPILRSGGIRKENYDG